MFLLAGRFEAVLCLSVASFFVSFRFVSYVSYHVFSLGYRIHRMFRPMTENPYLSIRKDDDFDGAVKEVELEMRHN